GNILRRSAPPPVATLEQIAFGPYVYHLDRGELRQGEATVHLTDRERDMLRILALARGETVPRSALTGDGSVNERAVDVQINRLRRKIERDPANPLFLQAVRGIGYRLGGQWLAGECVQGLDADRALCPCALDHDRADGGAAVGGGVRVHGAALEHGDAAFVRRRGAGRRRPDRRLQGLSAGQGPRAVAAH